MEYKGKGVVPIEPLKENWNHGQVLDETETDVLVAISSDDSRWINKNKVQVPDDYHFIREIILITRYLGWSVSYDNQQETVDGLIIGHNSFIKNIVNPAQHEKLYQYIKKVVSANKEAYNIKNGKCVSKSGVDHYDIVEIVNALLIGDPDFELE